MLSAIRNLDYNIWENIQSLLTPIDAEDRPFRIRQAIDRQAFSVGLYYPFSSDLDANRKAKDPAADMIAVARRHAAVQFYEYYEDRSRTIPWQTNIARSSYADRQLRLQTAIRRNNILREELALERGGLSALVNDPSQTACADQLRRRFSKARAVATLIDGYMTNGDDLPKTRGRPRGIKIMREALREAKLVNLSEKTLANYFNELKSTSVFHYLSYFQDCLRILQPCNPCDPKFRRRIMGRANSTDDLRAVCHLYNSVALELNEKYQFDFILLENVPKPEARTDYDSLARDKPNLKLTEAIKTVIGRTS